MPWWRAATYVAWREQGEVRVVKLEQLLDVECCGSVVRLMLWMAERSAWTCDRSDGSLE